MVLYCISFFHGFEIIQDLCSGGRTATGDASVDHIENGRKAAHAAGSFVELAIGHDRSALCLECNGIYLHVDRGFDPGLLREVLAVLKKG